MPNLEVPESGLSFDSVSERSSKSTTQDIIGLTLTDDLIEEMIQCVQNGKPIQLSLGSRPSLSFGNTTQQLADYQDPFAHEIYHSMPDYAPGFGKKVVVPFGKPCLAFQKMLNPRWTAENNLTKVPKSVLNATKSVTAGADNARETLERSMAMEKARKQENTTKLIGMKSGGNKSKFLSAHQGRLNDTPRSIPSSPALSGVGSPSLGPTSVPASQLITEQAKMKRRPIVHVLAVRPMSEKELRAKVDDLSDNDFAQSLNKVADKNASGQYELLKNYYKELDVWTFNYDDEDDRQKAIDNAIKHYDRMRIPQNDDEWERLKPIEKRGDGQSLSVVQARIAQGPIPRTPKINVSNADSGRDTPGQDSEALGNKPLSKLKSNISRSSSQQPTSTSTTKNKRVSEKDAQAKRLLSTKKKPTPVSATQKKEAPVKTGGAKVLSKQFVTESDDEEIAVKPPIATKKALSAPKRYRDEDGGNASNQPPKKARGGNGKPVERTAEQNNQSSQNSASSSRTKGTSPQKSSPLASSPPTNASDFASSANSSSASDTSTPRHHTTFNTKSSRSPVHKRNASSSSLSTTSSTSSTASYTKIDPKVLQIAASFRCYYPKYAELHRELSALREEDRDAGKQVELLAMHDRLVEMKAQIKAASMRLA